LLGVLSRPDGAAAEERHWSSGSAAPRSSYDLMYDGRFQLDGRQCDWTRTLSIRPGARSNLDRGRYPVVSFSILFFFFFSFSSSSSSSLSRSASSSSAVSCTLHTHTHTLNLLPKIVPGNRSFVSSSQGKRRKKKKK
jgi:hypothetical protein